MPLKRLFLAVSLLSVIMTVPPSFAATPAFICQTVMELAGARSFMDQNDRRLKKLGLFTSSGRSRLCGVGCASFVDETLRAIISKYSMPVPMPPPDSLYQNLVATFNSQSRRGAEPVAEGGVAPGILAQGLKKQFASLGNLIAIKTKGLSQNDPKDLAWHFDEVASKLSLDDLVGSSSEARLSILAMYYYDEKMQMKWGHWLYAYYYNAETNQVYLVDPNDPNRLLAAKVYYQTWQGKQYLRLKFDPGASPTTSKLEADANLLVPFLLTVDLKSEFLRRLNQLPI